MKIKLRRSFCGHSVMFLLFGCFMADVSGKKR